MCRNVGKRKCLNNRQKDTLFEFAVMKWSSLKATSTYHIKNEKKINCDMKIETKLTTFSVKKKKILHPK